MCLRSKRRIEVNNAFWIIRLTLSIDGINPHAQLHYELTVRETDRGIVILPG